MFKNLSKLTGIMLKERNNLKGIKLIDQNKFFIKKLKNIVFIGETKFLKN